MVLSLMKNSAAALGKYGVRCNALVPRTIKTQLNEKDLKDEKKKKYTKVSIPLGKAGNPENMIGPKMFLTTGKSAYVVCPLIEWIESLVANVRTVGCSIVGGRWAFRQPTLVPYAKIYHLGVQKQGEDDP